MAMWCTIRTYEQHARELGNAPAAEPVFFVKPSGCLHHGGELPVSTHPGEVHHEIECVILLNESMQPSAIAVGLDLTDRAAQAQMRAQQWPWAKGKCFRSSAVLGQWCPWREGWDALISPEHGLHLKLQVNDEVRQSAALSEIAIPPSVQIASLLRWAPVTAGDVLFTGTPAGVGQLFAGDALCAQLTNHQGEVLSEIQLRCN